MVDARPLPLRSSLLGMGRVASMISMLWEASFFLGGSLGAAGGRGHHGPLPWWFLLPFQRPRIALPPRGRCWLWEEFWLGFPYLHLPLWRLGQPRSPRCGWLKGNTHSLLS